MIHVFLVMTMIGISHSICFWVMTEPKFSMRKTAFIYSGYFVAFMCLAMMSYAAFGNSAVYLCHIVCKYDCCGVFHFFV